jgi:NAD(P)-dependent dehydrogenase (short-subunit alcohol dehydrogenase family)
MNLGIKDQVIIYTGAAGLIGSAACLELAREGANLCLIDPAVDQLNELKTRLESDFNIEVMVFSDLNTLDPSQIDNMLDQVVAKMGPPTCLINCAYPRSSDWHLKFEEIPLPSWQSNVDQHLNGYFLVTQRVAKIMMNRKAGNIINFSSIYGLVGPDFSVYDGIEGMTMPAAYSVIKGGISNFTRYLAAYLGPYGIRVNAICPGGVKNSQNERFVENYEKKVPLRTMATTESVVGPLIFLVSSMSSYCTGLNLAVDGGWTAY